MAGLQFNQGDWIVHARHGVGQIKRIDRKKFHGSNQQCYRVKTFDLIYWLPVERSDVDYIRPIASKHVFRKAITALGKKPVKMDDNHTIRDKKILETLNSGSIVKLAELIRDLNYRETIEKLNVLAKDTLVEVKQRFLDEWIIATGIDRQDAEQRLDNALERSVNRVK